MVTSLSCCRRWDTLAFFQSAISNETVSEVHCLVLHSYLRFAAKRPLSSTFTTIPKINNLYYRKHMDEHIFATKAQTTLKQVPRNAFTYWLVIKLRFSPCPFPMTLQQFESHMRYLLAKSMFEATNLEEYMASVFETSTTQYVVLCATVLPSP